AQAQAGRREDVDKSANASQRAEKAATSDPRESQARYRVRATRLGFQSNIRRYPGDVFYMTAFEYWGRKVDRRTGRASFVPPKWVELVDASVPLQASTANDIARREHAELLARKMGSGGTVAGTVPAFNAGLATVGATGPDDDQSALDKAVDRAHEQQQGDR